MTLREIPNFLSKEECEYIIQLIEKNNQKSTVAEAGKAATLSTHRTSSTSNLSASDETVSKIHKRIAEFLKLPIEKGEHLQGQKYEPGQYFKDHTDYFQGVSYDQHCLSSGNRTHTLMLYLNDVESGGETSFPLLDTMIKPTQGTAVMWNNLKKDGTFETDALHSGTEVLKGTKYIITSWWRENDWNAAEDQRLAKEKETQMTTDSTKKQFKHYDELPKVSEKGYKIIDIPADALELIKEAYEAVKDSKKEETFAGKETIIPGHGVTSDILSLDAIPELRGRIHEILKPIHEEFAKEPIEPTYIYGIRSYNKGAKLVQHRDRIATHQISSIILVEKNLACGCGYKEFGADWGLEVQTHSGNWETVYLEPGQMVLYESAVCSHGRDKPFEGKYYRNMFVHYKLSNWEYVGDPQ